ncbi:hypothetical protein SAMN04515647_1201 [Cohaesibacter sp. ES.047]|nr:hypothetical protein SAMN04515647_1201 [Cohaesibacter sp. ES.047]
MHFCSRNHSNQVGQNDSDRWWPFGNHPRIICKFGKGCCAGQQGQMRSQPDRRNHHQAVTTACQHRENHIHLIHQPHTRVGTDV